MARNKFKSYESVKEHDNFIQLTNSLLMHPNFLNLHYSSQVLYLYMRSWSKGRMEFEFPESLGRKIVNSNTTFWNNINELEIKGFIKSVKRCKTTRNPNVYRFSDNWHKK